MLNTFEGVAPGIQGVRVGQGLCSLAVAALLDFVKVGTFEKPVRRPVHIEQQACRQKYPAIFGKNLTT